MRFVAAESAKFILRSNSKIVRLVHCCSAFHDVKPAGDNSVLRNRYHVQGSSYRAKTFLSNGTQLHLPGITMCRYKSDVSTPLPEVTPAYIPEPPSIDVISPAIEQLNALGEPTLASIGLCSSYPPGWVQSLLEYIHVTAELPWWASIAVFAVALRLAIIPLQIYALKISVGTQNVMPKYMALQSQLEEATARGDLAAGQLLSMKVEAYKNKYDVRLWRSGMGLLYQIPIFWSVMRALRGMAYLPVPSMTTGGMLWFTDLTVTDPYILLPVMTAVTLLITVEIGADGMRTNDMPKARKNLLRGVILLGTPSFMMFNPAALGVYWFTSNIMAVSTNYIIKIPSIKKRLGIPDAINPQTASPFTKPDPDGIVQKMSRGYKERKIRSTMDNKESISSKAFDDASRAKIVKTYRYDPTKTKSVPQ